MILHKVRQESKVRVGIIDSLRERFIRNSVLLRIDKSVLLQMIFNLLGVFFVREQKLLTVLLLHRWRGRPRRIQSVQPFFFLRIHLIRDLQVFTVLYAQYRVDIYRGFLDRHICEHHIWLLLNKWKIIVTFKLRELGPFLRRTGI